MSSDAVAGVHIHPNIMNDTHWATAVPNRTHTHTTPAQRQDTTQTEQISPNIFEPQSDSSKKVLASSFCIISLQTKCEAQKCYLQSNSTLESSYFVDTGRGGPALYVSRFDRQTPPSDTGSGRAAHRIHKPAPRRSHSLCSTCNAQTVPPLSSRTHCCAGLLAQNLRTRVYLGDQLGYLKIVKRKQSQNS